MDGLAWFYLILLGATTGVYGILIGAGGGFIVAPILLIFFGMDPALAAGTSIALVAINSFAGLPGFWKTRLIDYRTGLIFAAAAVPGSILAPYLIDDIGGNIFRLLLGIFLMGVAIQIAFLPTKNRNMTDSPRHRIKFFVTKREIKGSDGRRYQYEFNELLAALLNFFLGFLSSLFGSGGGFIRTAFLVSFFGFPIRIAAVTSVFALAFYSTVGTLTHAALGHVEWYPTVLWAGLGKIIGGIMGARLLVVIQEKWILRLLLLVVFILGVKLIFDGFKG